MAACHPESPRCLADQPPAPEFRPDVSLCSFDWMPVMRVLHVLLGGVGEGDGAEEQTHRLGVAWSRRRAAPTPASPPVPALPAFASPSLFPYSSRQRGDARRTAAAPSAAAAASAVAARPPCRPVDADPLPVDGSVVITPLVPPLVPPLVSPGSSHCPLGQSQTPSKQVSPSPQTIPHPPQLLLSQQVATQVPSQSTSPSSQPSPVGEQVPSEQTPLSQTVPHAPQLAGSDETSTHSPLPQQTNPGTQSTVK